MQKILVVAATMIVAWPMVATAGGMTCKDYADPKIAFAYCRGNINKSGQATRRSPLRGLTPKSRLISLR
jgi:hypothetical protein